MAGTVRRQGRGQPWTSTDWTFIPLRAPLRYSAPLLLSYGARLHPLIPVSPDPVRPLLSVMPKSAAKPADKKNRHQPLHVEIDLDNDMAKYGRVSQPEKRRRSRKTEDEEREEEVRC